LDTVRLPVGHSIRTTEQNKIMWYKENNLVLRKEGKEVEDFNSTNICGVPDYGAGISTLLGEGNNRTIWGKIDFLPLKSL
jgi:hypothetical protein